MTDTTNRRIVLAGLKKLSTLIRNDIIAKVDHKNINLDVPFMEGKRASCEILVKEFWKILEPAVLGITDSGHLHCLKLIETSRNYVEFYGE